MLLINEYRGILLDITSYYEVLHNNKRYWLLHDIMRLLVIMSYYALLYSFKVYHELLHSITGYLYIINFSSVTNDEYSVTA